MKLKLTVLTVCVLLIVSGCATHPNKIAPNYVSPITYKDLSLEQLKDEEKNIQKALDISTAQQIHTRGNDTMGVIFLGLPIGSLSGNNQAQHIANLKGQLVAIREQISKKELTH